MFEPGDLVLVPFPFTDLSAAKNRPALVVSRADYNRRSRDVIVCAVTSNLANAANSVLIEERNMASGKLPLSSRVKVDKLATLDRSVVRRTVGRLDPATLDRVLMELFALFPALTP